MADMGKNAHFDEVAQRNALQLRASEHNLQVMMNQTAIQIDPNSGKMSATVTIKTPEEFLQFLQDMELFGIMGDREGAGATHDMSYRRGDFGFKNRRGAEGEEDTRVGITIPADADSLLPKTLADGIKKAIKKGQPLSTTVTYDTFDSAGQTIQKTETFPVQLEVHTPVIERFFAIQDRGRATRLANGHAQATRGSNTADNYTGSLRG